MQEIKRICPWSVGRYFGGLWLTLGMIAGVIGLLAWIFELLPNMEPGPLILTFLMGTIGYSLMGYVTGVVAALVYNAIASAFGGIRISFEQKDD